MPTNYNGYTIPSPTDIADAPAAFEQFSDSIPFSEYVAIESLSADTTVVDSYNGKMIFATADLTLTFGTLTSGFSVAVTADTGVTVDYLGVDKVDQESTAYQIAAVIAVNGTNIISKSGTSYIDPNLEPEPEPEPEPVIDLRVPQPPVITNPEGGDIINFTPGVDGTAGETLIYGAGIEPNTNGESVVVDQDNLTIVVEGTSIFTNYVVSVYGVNVAGAGLPSLTDPFQLNFNLGTGGTVRNWVRTVDGFDENWQSHTFTGTAAFNVISSHQQFEGLVLGGGQGGPYSHPADIREYSGANGPAKVEYIDLPKGSVTCTVGGGGAGATAVHNNGSGGGASAIGSFLNSSGGGSVTTDIYNGTNMTWAGNGYGAGGASAYLATAPSGQAGILVVAYRVS